MHYLLARCHAPPYVPSVSKTLAGRTRIEGPKRKAPAQIERSKRATVLPGRRMIGPREGEVTGP